MVTHVRLSLRLSLRCLFASPRTPPIPLGRAAREAERERKRESVGGREGGRGRKIEKEREEEAGERERERESGVFPYDVRYTERSRGPRSACFAYTSRSAGVLHFFSFYVRTSSLALSFSLSFSLSLHLTVTLSVFVAEREWQSRSEYSRRHHRQRQWTSWTVDDVGDDRRVPPLRSARRSIRSIRGSETGTGPRALLVFAYQWAGRSSSLGLPTSGTDVGTSARSSGTDGAAVIGVLGNRRRRRRRRRRSTWAALSDVARAGSSGAVRQEGLFNGEERRRRKGSRGGEPRECDDRTQPSGQRQCVRRLLFPTVGRLRAGLRHIPLRLVGER